MASVTVRFFGLLLDTTEVSELSMPIDSKDTAASLLIELTHRFPDLAHRSYRLVHNNTFVEDAPLRDGDEIALMPPFAGG